MHKEIELKVLNIEPTRVRSSLKRAGARRLMKQALLKEWYFQIPGLAKKEWGTYSLRLRSEGKYNVLTAKKTGRDKRYNLNKEIEINIPDVKKMMEILHMLGFRVFREREKKREIYRLRKSEIVIDQYPGIPPYIEIEGPTKKVVERIVSLLGYDLMNTTNKTATDVIKDASKNPNKLLFKG